MKSTVKILTVIGSLAFSTALPQPTLAGETAGVSAIKAASKERGSDLAVTVWYPADKGGRTVTLGEGPFFTGTVSAQDAPIAKGHYPLILLSHGAGLAGNPQALSWIATPLASHGFIVAAPAHPGNGGPDRSAAETMKLWLRPADISDTLEAVENNAAFRDHIEPGKTGMLGLSMGGNTALAIAGARLDPQRLAGYCDTDALNASLCAWVRASGVDLHTMDLGAAGRDMRDRRIGFAMAIDPAPVDVFEPKSFSAIPIPIDLVNLGQADKMPVTTDAAQIAKSIPDARYATIDDASHYSMFAECKQGISEAAIAEQIGDPVCSDGGGRPRGEIHTRLIDIVTAAFDRALRSGL
jgi:predicted dienelactone hydrolase